MSIRTFAKSEFALHEPLIVSEHSPHVLVNSTSAYIFQTIDLDELEKILDNNHIMFTKSQVNDILKEIDADKTGTLDFLEVLEVSLPWKSITDSIVL